MVDIYFDQKNTSKEQLFFNEMYSPIFEKKRVLSATERSAFQLLDAMRLNDKGTMDEQIAITFYAEHLHFPLTKCWWKVTKIRGHYTFEKKIQERFCDYESSFEAKRENRRRKRFF